MQNPHALRHLARRCRNFVTVSTALPVVKQLRLWAVELADRADEVERAAMSRVSRKQSTRHGPRGAKASRSRMAPSRPR